MKKYSGDIGGVGVFLNLNEDLDGDVKLSMRDIKAIERIVKDRVERHYKERKHQKRAHA